MTSMVTHFHLASDIVTRSINLIARASIFLTLFLFTEYLTASDIDYKYETESVTSLGDAADDPAIWFNELNPTESLIFGTDKRKGIHVYDIYGNELAFSRLGATNNIDLRVINEDVHLVVSNRTLSTLDYWIFPEENLFDYFKTNASDPFRRM